MDTNALFQAALGIVSPWAVVRIAFDPKAAEGKGQLDLYIDFPRGARFACPTCLKPCPVHDAAERSWRHLDFFQHLAYLHARAPRTDCPEHGVLTAGVPWAREGSGFTLLFEALAVFLAAEMPMAAISRLVGEHDTRLWRVVEHHVAVARQRVEMSAVTTLVVDETSRAKGHAYVAIFAEPGAEKGRVLFVADGKDHSTFHAFLADFKAHGGQAAAVSDIAMDMSGAFQRGATETLPMAAITFDRFHVMKLVGDAVDQVRRAEAKERPELAGTRYHWLRNEEDLSPSDKAAVASLSSRNLRTAKAYQLRLTLRELWACADAAEARGFLSKWCALAMRVTRPRKDGKATGFEPLRKAATTIRAGGEGILHYFRRRMTTAVLEGINSIAQAARSRARGYRNAETFKAIIYLLAGRLPFELPVVAHNP